MTKKNQKYKFLHRIRVKEKNKRLVPNNGTETWIAGKMIPPYTKVNNFKLDFSIVGDGAGVVPDSSMETYIRGAMVNIDPSQEMQEAAADVTGDVMVGRYLDPLPWDLEDAAEVDLGIAGDNSFISPSLRRRTLRDEYIPLGLPDAAVFNNSDLILYTTKRKWRGKVQKDIEDGCWSFDEAKFVAFAMTAENPDVQQDWGDCLWGGVTDVRDLYQLVYELGKYASDAAVGSGFYNSLSSSLAKYMHGSYHEGASLGQALWVKCKLTLDLSVYEPVGQKIYTMAG